MRIMFEWQLAMRYARFLELRAPFGVVSCASLMLALTLLTLPASFVSAHFDPCHRLIAALSVLSAADDDRGSAVTGAQVRSFCCVSAGVARERRALDGRGHSQQ